MGILDKIFRRQSAEEDVESTKGECKHGVLVPRWDDVSDIGKDEVVSSFLCEACNSAFTPDEGRTLQGSLAERVRLG